MINIISLTFVIKIFVAKKIVNTYKENIKFKLKNMQIKNLVKNITKQYQNIFYQIKILKYNIK